MMADPGTVLNPAPAEAHPPAPPSAWFSATVIIPAAATFVSAVLLFLVQPLIARFILPWFGGSSGVWTTCLLFFQACLLAGYAYAHGLTRLGLRSQAWVHGVLLITATILLPIAPSAALKPSPDSEPIAGILRLLAVCVGLPFLALSATGPLVQAWFSRMNAGRSPYPLYALSNAGSLLALLAYPLAVEPWLTRQAQSALWSAGFVLFSVLCAACALLVTRRAPPPPQPAAGADPAGAPEPTPARTWLLWLALPACASMLLMAVTNTLCQDVAAVPFLWILPLSAYLLSFILSFEGPRWYSRRILHPASMVAVALLLYTLFAHEWVPWVVQSAIHVAALFVACMFCHGEVHRLRPAPGRLTGFYLLIALGGALGGGFVAVIAPRAFDTYAELHVALGFFTLLAVAIHRRDRIRLPFPRRPVLSWPWALAGAIGVTGALLAELWVTDGETVLSHRNFYGVSRILERQKDHPFNHALYLYSGGIAHGMQFQHPVKAAWPTSYYHEQSGAGAAIGCFPTNQPRRIGVVGLGVGTMAAYGQPGDVVRFYEINPYVIELARTRFTYLERCRGKVEVALGDARLVLEREAPQQFHVLVLDAFSGDAIPVHLLTREAFEIYRRHLVDDGVLAVHISNRHLNLAPVVRALGDFFAWPSALQSSSQPAAGPKGDYPCNWMLLTHNERLRSSRALRFSQPPSGGSGGPFLWTDDFASLFKVLNLGIGRRPGVF